LKRGQNQSRNQDLLTIQDIIYNSDSLIELQTDEPFYFANKLNLIPVDKPTHLVNRDVRIFPVHGPEGETTLLELRLGVVPVLIDDELLKTGKEADLGEHPAELLKCLEIK
jgi:hypothetical protein